MPPLILLAGIPAAGKTTVVELLPRPFYDRIHFGGLLREAVAELKHRELSHEQFRHGFADLLDATVIEHATRRARQLADSSTATACVLDSHAVTPSPVGLRVTPDGPNLQSILLLAGIVHLDTTQCIGRVLRNSRTAGRFPLTTQTYALAEELQRAVLVAYSVAYGCPMVSVSSAGDPADTTAAVDTAVRSLLRWTGAL